MQAIEPAIGSPGKGVQRFMGVLRAEAAGDNLKTICLTGAFGILQMPEVR